MSLIDLATRAAGPDAGKQMLQNTDGQDGAATTHFIPST